MKLKLLKTEVNLKKSIIKHSSLQVYKYIKTQCFLEIDNVLIINKNNFRNIQNQDIKINTILSLDKINDVRYINKFLELINQNLPIEGKFVCCVETFQARKEKKWINNIPILRQIYFLLEYFLLRFPPKIKFLKTLYFSITKGENRLLSKSEV